MSFYWLSLLCLAPSISPAEAAAETDRLLREEVAAPAAALTDDEVFLRRVSLDLIGRPPTPEEIIRFAIDPAENKRREVIRQLLQDREFGVNWGRYWRDVIFSRRSEDRALLAARPTEQFLTEQFHRNRPWSETAAKLITAKGDVQEEGAAGLIAAQAGRPEETVAEISRIFLGIQIQCAQCHDHPTDSWKREQFHQLAAFFPRVAVRPQNGDGKRTLLVVAQDRFFFRRTNNNNRFVGASEHHMKDLDNPQAIGELMQPVFFATGQKLKIGSTDKQRRESLAAWVSDADKNPWFARAFVNRVWSELAGEGFYEPVDDLGPDRPISAPKTMEYLSRQFARSGYDVKWLYETIANTRTYQQVSRPRRSLNDPPFAANVSQPLRGDQFFNSLLLAFELPEAELNRRRGGNRGPRTSFSLAFGYDPSTPREEVAATIPQALIMMNSPFLQQASSTTRFGGLGGWLRRFPNNRQLVLELYLRTVSRQPAEEEMETALRYFQQVKGRTEAAEDLLWALVNSTEFTQRR